MLISELFYSIQGEGKRTGFPSFFIRTNYCNLRCKFTSGNLCDSAYTSWHPQDKNNTGDMGVEEIIDEYIKYKPADIVITGGEPTTQKKELKILCEKLKNLDNNIFITLETNGTNYGNYLNFINLASISPKLRTSVPWSTGFEKMHDKNRINIKALRVFQKFSSRNLIDIQWKFVITEENDINEIFQIQNKIGIESRNIFLMPEGMTKEEIEDKRMMITKLCLKHKYNYSDRLHILLWRNERGK